MRSKTVRLFCDIVAPRLDVRLYNATCSMSIALIDACRTPGNNALQVVMWLAVGQNHFMVRSTRANCSADPGVGWLCASKGAYGRIWGLDGAALARQGWKLTNQLRVASKPWKQVKSIEGR
jgi:hypothetical protein